MAVGGVGRSELEVRASLHVCKHLGEVMISTTRV